MKSMIFGVAALVSIAGIALAQQSSDQNASLPAIGMGSKTMDSCREDTGKYCAASPGYVRKECLVKNWNRISSDCQDALGKPMDVTRRSGGE